MGLGNIMLVTPRRDLLAEREDRYKKEFLYYLKMTKKRLVELGITYFTITETRSGDIKIEHHGSIEDMKSQYLRQVSYKCKRSDAFGCIRKCFTVKEIKAFSGHNFLLLEL